MFDQVYTKKNSLLFHFISSPYWLVSISYTIILNCYFKFYDHIALLLSQLLIELFKFQFFMTKSNCCFNLSLNWCFNSHDHIQLLFQFNTIPIQKCLINCKELCTGFKLVLSDLKCYKFTFVMRVKWIEHLVMPHSFDWICANHNNNTFYGNLVVLEVFGAFWVCGCVLNWGRNEHDPESGLFLCA
jgi:hypothetical protein